MLNKKINKASFEAQAYIDHYKTKNPVIVKDLPEYKAMEDAKATLETSVTTAAETLEAYAKAAQAYEAAHVAAQQAENDKVTAGQVLAMAQAGLQSAQEIAECDCDMQAGNYANEQIAAAQADYAETAAWCNENNAAIEDKGDYYEVVDVPHPTEMELRLFEINSELAELQAYLTSTDYIAVKIAEGAATREDYADALAQRQEARERINELQGELAELETPDDK